MRSSLWMIRLSLLGLALEVSSPAAREAGASWEGEWQKVLRAAEKEGQVDVYGINPVGNNLRVIWEGFQQRFPNIKLNSAILGRGADMVPKIMAERRAGKYLADVVLAGPTTLYTTFYPARILDPVPPLLLLSEVTDRSQWWQGKHHYVDPDQQYIFLYEGSLYSPPLSYNTKLVNAEEIRSVWDVLQPKWRGKIEALHVKTNIGGSTGLIFLYHHAQIGPRFIEKLYQEMEVTLFRDFRQATDWLAQGRFTFCLLCRDIQRAAEQGLPVAELHPYRLKELPGIGAGNGAIGFMKQAPHPNAAKVFINWYLSREGQIAFRQANRDNDRKTSLREDLPLDILPELARRSADREYLFINRPEWMDFEPVRALIERISGKGG